MEFENLLTLMNTMSESNLTEFLYEEKEVKILFSKLKTSVISGVNEKKSGQEAETAPAMGPVQPTVVVTNTAQTADDDSQIISSKAGAAEGTKNADEKSAVTEQPAGNIVASPLVGVFYAAPAEDAAPYVTEGARVEKGQTLAIVEAMKLMNEIESEYTGTVAEIYVENGQAVEYGQPLFRIV